MADVMFALKKLINLEFILPKVDYTAEFRREDVKRSQSMKRNQSAINFSAAVPSSPKRMVVSTYPPQKAHIKLNVNVNPMQNPIHYIMKESNAKNQS